MPHFSLVIIGSGSGNLVLPKDPAQGPVALIESGAFGGTCVNRGCIPSKIEANKKAWEANDTHEAATAPHGRART